MKIVAVHGSARRNSSSIRAARDLVNELKSDDAEVKEYFTSDMNIKSCKCCFACRKKEICIIQNDDMDILYQDIITADLTVFSSPLFMGDVSGSFKLMLDRLYPPLFLRWPSRAVHSQASRDEVRVRLCPRSTRHGHRKR